jgi:regulator of protease activity HflC (stomatin/prohibitin superfamily)
LEASLVIFAILLLAIVVLALYKSVQIIPQASAAIVERFGRYIRTLHPGLWLLVPFIDRIRIVLDLREQVVPFPPQPVITQDNLLVSIDTVIYYQITDAKAATYEIASFIQAIEQLTVTTLRNIVGGMDLERTLTSREEINDTLRGVLDEATGRWGIRVNRVELKAIDPPPGVQDAMEKQMRAERERRATILTAEGFKQSEILRAEGEKQAAILRAEGEAKAISQVFEAIHSGNPDQKLLSYQYLQMLPRIAQGDSNKVWIVPSELGKALEGLGAVSKFVSTPFQSAGEQASPVGSGAEPTRESTTAVSGGKSSATDSGPRVRSVRGQLPATSQEPQSSVGPADQAEHRVRSWSHPESDTTIASQGTSLQKPHRSAPDPGEGADGSEPEHRT